MKKNLYSLILVGSLFTSCVSYRLSTGSENKKTITDIPLRISTDKVDIYFNEDAPSVPFYKVQIVDVKSDVSVGYDDLLKKLTQHAQDLGLDAILVLDKTVWTENPNGYYTSKHRIANYTIPVSGNSFQQLSAIGVKYKSNLSYMDTIVKSAAVDYFINGEKHHYNLDFDFYGNLVTTDNVVKQFFTDNIAPFDLIQHTHAGIADWEYENINDVLISFRLAQNDLTWVSAVVAPESTSTFFTVDYAIRDRKTFKKSKYSLNCLFDKSGKLVEKKLWQHQRLVWKEELVYDGNKLTGFRRYKINADKKELTLESTNTFFSVADLPAPVGNVASTK